MSTHFLRENEGQNISVMYKMLTLPPKHSCPYNLMVAAHIKWTVLLDHQILMRQAQRELVSVLFCMKLTSL